MRLCIRSKLSRATRSLFGRWIPFPVPDAVNVLPVTIDSDISVMIKSSCGVCAALCGLLLLSLAGSCWSAQQQQAPPGAADSCAIAAGSESYADLVQRVVRTAENQAFLMTQRYKASEYPTSVLPNGTWEVQRAGD